MIRFNRHAAQTIVTTNILFIFCDIFFVIYHKTFLDILFYISYNNIDNIARRCKIKKRLIAKLSSFVLSLCILTPIIADIPHAIEERENQSAVTYEDVIAGIASPTQLSISGDSNSQISTMAISNGTYFLNNLYHGEYLKYRTNHSASAFTLDSGLISSLGNYIKWNVKAVSGGYAICSKKDTSLYLGVHATTLNEAKLELVTINNGDSIPNRCVWNISNASTGGVTIQSAHNNRYLYSSGLSVSTVASLGTEGSDAYKKGVWRMPTESLLTSRELDSNFSISNITVAAGASKTPTINKSPSTAMWASATDFSYLLKSTSYASLSGATFTGKSSGVTTVIATHKPTGRQYVFSVITGSTPTYTLKSYVDLGRRLDSSARTNISAAQTFVAEKLSRMFGLNVTTSVTNITSYADTCKITRFGSVTASNVTVACNHTAPHTTSVSMMNFSSGVGAGTNTVSKVIWTGHTLPEGNNRSRAIPSSNFAIITMYQSEDSDNHRKFVFLHEVSHLLGTHDHYCYNDGYPCSNKHCDTCYMGRSSTRSCLMTAYNGSYQLDDISTYCNDCIIFINDHISDHHQ